MNAECDDLLWMMSCRGGSPVSLDTLRKAAEAGEYGSKSKLHKSFYTNVPSEYLDDMEQSVVKRMGLEFDSSKKHYHVKVYCPITLQCNMNYDLFWVQMSKWILGSAILPQVFDKHQSDSTISCKCTVEEDGSLVIHKVSLS